MQRKNERFVERLPLAMAQPWLAYVLTTLLCGVALLTRLAAQPVLSTGYPYVAFFPAILISSFLFGARAGALATVLCGVAAWYFFIPPVMTFALHSSAVMALVFYASVAGIQTTIVHWMQRANHKLGEERARSAELADNRELLFRELQHRVSNNIQVVAALLSLQRRDVTDESARKALDQASARLSLIGKISRTLYEPGASDMGVRTFIETLADDILEASGRRDIHVHLDVEDGVALKPESAVPFSLIVAEAVSNAIEHGLAGRDSGSIAVTLRRSPKGELLLDIVDDGCGLPSDFLADKHHSLGLRIAATLARQLGGRFELVPAAGGGARAALAIPA